jgi:hypothetical protein
VMMGFAGQLSLGHSLYVGVGAYAAGRDLLPLRHRAVGRAVGGDPALRGARRRRSAFSPSASASRACISRFSPSPSPSSRASASTISTGSAAPAGCSCAWRSATPGTSPISAARRSCTTTRCSRSPLSPSSFAISC